MILTVSVVITVSEPSWTAPFTGLSPRSFSTLVTHLRREGADTPARGRLWKVLLEDQVLPAAAYVRTNLTMRQLAPLKAWKILRDCRLRGDGVRHAVHGVARLHKLALPR